MLGNPSTQNEEFKNSNTLPSNDVGNDLVGSSVSNTIPPILKMEITCTRQLVKLIQHFNNFLVGFSEDTTKLASLVEVAHLPKWVDAMKQEMHSTEKKQTWVFDNLALGRKDIMTKWIFKLKTHADETTTKVRLVACEFQ
jgi:hypothetical protein